MIMRVLPVKKTMVLIVIAVLVLGGGVAGFMYWKSKPSRQAIQNPPVVTIPLEPLPPQILEAPPEPRTLPLLSESDAHMLDALADLMNKESFLKYFHPAHLIEKMVATIDSLPRRHLPEKIVPVKRLPGPFPVEGPEGNYTISPKNAARYAVYVNMAEQVDARKLVEVYIRFYPLFQEAYVKLGYPDKYFNDRLMAVIEHLLAAPNIKEPVWLQRPNVLYLYAEPDLEARSAGQKILMRMGGKNSAIVKSRLREIKQEVMLHMIEKKIVPVP